jgi:hypothetical protein
MQVSRSLRALPGVAVVWLIMRPRRRPHLARVPRTAAFRTDRAAAAAWVEEQFRLIEAAVPWLERAGLTVEDGCGLSRDVHGWVVSHRDRWHISCTRTVTAVYGASGTAVTQINELAAAVGAAGWACYGDGIPDPVARLAELVLDPFQRHGAGHATAGWRPAKGAEPPPGWRPPAPPLAARPPLSLIIHAERTQPALAGPAPALPPLLRGIQSLGPPPATPFYQPVELSEEDTTTLVKRTSATAGHVFVVSIRITYHERSR